MVISIQDIINGNIPAQLIGDPIVEGFDFSTHPSLMGTEIISFGDPDSDEVPPQTGSLVQYEDGYRLSDPDPPPMSQSDFSFSSDAANEAIVVSDDSSIEIFYDNSTDSIEITTASDDSISLDSSVVNEIMLDSINTQEVFEPEPTCENLTHTRVSCGNNPDPTPPEYGEEDTTRE